VSIKEGEENMTDREIALLIAKHFGDYERTGPLSDFFMPEYTTSFDHALRVLRASDIGSNDARYELCCMMGYEDYEVKFDGLEDAIEWLLFTATPRDICVAMLRLKGIEIDG